MTQLKQKILVVDDEPEARTAMAQMLQANGYEVLEASDGNDGLSRANSDGPSLIILDMVLPDISGMEVLENLRANLLTKEIPVLLLTGKTDGIDKFASFQKFSDRYMQKPGRIDDILQIVRNMLDSTKNP